MPKTWARVSVVRSLLAVNVIQLVFLLLQFQVLFLGTEPTCSIDSNAMIHDNSCIAELPKELKAEYGMPLWEENAKNIKIQIDGHIPEDMADGKATPTVYLITTTYQRDTQKANLVTLCQTLMHVRSLVWIVVENSVKRTRMVAALLRRCGVPFVHLTTQFPDHTYIRPSSEIVGIQHRNAGLRWLRANCKIGGCRGGVYFGDDDDRYDLRLFDEIRYTKSISVFMVGLTGGLLMEGPHCKEERVDRWHHVWGKSREVPVDMQGFAINIRLVLKRKGVWLEGTDVYNDMGYMAASKFISRFLPRTTLECKTFEKEVLVWRSRTMQPETFREPDERSNTSIEY